MNERQCLKSLLYNLSSLYFVKLRGLEVGKGPAEVHNPFSNASEG